MLRPEPLYSVHPTQPTILQHWTRSTIVPYLYCIIGRIEYSSRAGAGYRRSQHKSGSEWALPLSSVHKLRITRSWSNCDKPQIRRFLHVSPKEDTITMIWVSRCSSYTTYDKATDIVISQRLGCYYMCHQSLCRHQDTTKLIFSDTNITSTLRIRMFMVSPVSKQETKRMQNFDIIIPAQN